MTHDEQARAAIGELRSAGQEYAAAVEREMTLEAGRPARKLAAIQRIMASGDNPLTHKPHSASSAEAVVETDHDYHACLMELREAVVAKNNAYSALTCARLEAELAIALVRAESEVSA